VIRLILRKCDRFPVTHYDIRSPSLSSPTYSCGVACSSKEVSSIVKYTKDIPNDGKNSFASLIQRRDPSI